jgi:catechol 2,3-dioxygenase-like lactoylglutathione lyase family enzyme
MFSPPTALDRAVRCVARHEGGNAAMIPQPRYERVAIGSIVIRCYEYDRMVAFWRAVLGYEVAHADPNGGFVILRDPGGRGPNISIDQSPVRRSGKRSWLHLDLYTRNQSDEVERLVALGARRYPWRYDPGADYVVLEDPDGNLFCVVEVPEKEAQ